jgi:transcriptional regulator with XRE-family HTH domain
MSDLPDAAIAERIDEAIKRRGLSYSEVARRTGVTPAAAWSWAAAKTVLSVERIKTLAAVLGEDPAYLAFGAPSAKTEVAAPLRWKFSPDTLELAEYTYEDSPLEVPVQKWRLSRRFVNEVLGVNEQFSFLVENKQKIEGYLAPGDMLFIDKTNNNPSRHGDGFYLIFHPFFPTISYISKDGSGKETRYVMRDLGDDATTTVTTIPSPVIGKVVGTIQRWHFTKPI